MSYFFGSGYVLPRIVLALLGGGAFFWTKNRLDRLVAISKAAENHESLAEGAPPLHKENSEPLTAKRL